MLSMVISGGQTGADRAVLDAALQSAFPVGGSCPAGRMAEDGPISEAYPLTEISGSYRQRTKQNVLDSDGTAIFYESHVRGGTEATTIFCVRHRKPYKLIDIELIDPPLAAEALRAFIREFDIRVLNVAGPRAGGCPAMYDYVRQGIRLLLPQAT